MLPSTITPEAITAIIDTREQMPLDLAPLRTERGTLTTGDYSIRGLEHVVAIERKSLGDLLSCCGNDRDRFQREVDRLLAYPVRALVIESSWKEIEAGQWRSKLQPQHVLGSIMGWMEQGLPWVLADDHERAGRFVSRLLFIAARRRWREARALVADVLQEQEAAA